ncbi:ribose 5-phosphate isomerase A [soil metagenome]
MRDGMRVGLGSGSTARAFVECLGRRVADGLGITAVASSTSTAELANSVGIPVAEHDTALDLAVDGADAVARSSLAAIKGLGGALVRERLVAEAAFEFVLIVDDSKLFEQLSDSQPDVPVPVEILPFGWKLTRDRLASFGEPRLRVDSKGVPDKTDNGNLIIDLHGCDYGSLDELASGIKMLSGVVDHGLFLHLATTAIVGTAKGVLQLQPVHRRSS